MATVETLPPHQPTNLASNLPPAADGLQLPHDILLPDPVSGWPPAPGWWLLMALVLALGVWAIVRWRSERRRRAPLRLALAELNLLAHNPGLSDRAFLSACNQLLRRVAIIRHGRADAAGLIDERWLDFLDNSQGSFRDKRIDADSGTLAFKHGPGRALLSAYQADSVCDRPALQALIRTWLQAQYPPRRLRHLLKRRSHV